MVVIDETSKFTQDQWRKMKPRLVLRDFSELEKIRFTDSAASEDSTST
jgi:hypothetical protein